MNLRRAILNFAHPIRTLSVLSHLVSRKDVSRIDFCMGFFHFSWTAPIQLTICLVLLLTNLGVSSLVGFAFFVAVFPLQSLAMKKLVGMRKRSMIWTDKRAKLLQELLPNMRVLKYFAWEKSFLKRIGQYRSNELKYIRNLLVLRGLTSATAVSLPIFAAILSFITYSLLGHSLQAPIVFTSLTLFQLLRLPLIILRESHHPV